VGGALDPSESSSVRLPAEGSVTSNDTTPEAGGPSSTRALPKRAARPFLIAWAVGHPIGPAVEKRRTRPPAIAGRSSAAVPKKTDNAAKAIATRGVRRTHRSSFTRRGL
jgi:hypothetical protein